MLYLSKNSPALASQPLCWQPDSIAPYESYWSIFRKLARLNATTAGGVVELLKCGGVISSTQRPNLKLDLLRCDPIDPKLLAGFLQLQSVQIQQASALTYLKVEEVAALSSKHLRYCRTCLRAGYHSTLHQFLFLRRCPAHAAEILTETCATCGHAPILYDMRSVGVQPAAERSCCLGISNREGNCLTRTTFEKFGPIASLLAERSRLKTIDQPIERWLGRQCKLERRRQKLPRLIKYWQDLLSTQLAGPQHDVRRKSKSHHISPVHHTAIVLRSLPNDLGVDSYMGEDKSLAIIYKSIYRHLAKTHLRAHRACTELLIRRMWFESDFINRGKTCTQAQAILLWRMCWERVRTPHELNTKRSRATVYWDPPSYDIPRLALYRIFALECLALFEECLLLAKRFHRQDIFSFNKGWVRYRRLPYWALQINHDGSTVIRWWPRSQGPPVSLPTTIATTFERKARCFIPDSLAFSVSEEFAPNLGISS
jgi:hypothetical protein